MREATIQQVIDTLDNVGFCVLPSVLPLQRARELRDLLDDLRAREPRADVDELGHHRVLHLAAKDTRFVELMCHPVPLAIWERVLGPDCICSTWTSNTVLPHNGSAYWHVDHPYWTIAAPYPVEPALTGQTIWCLDEFTEDNGATKFIAGSHRRTHIPAHNGNYDHEGVTLTAPQGS